MSLSANRTWPRVGFCSPVITLKQVVLPAPLGPIRPVIRPGSTAKDAWSTAVTPPNWTTTSSTSSSATDCHLLLLVAGPRADEVVVRGPLGCRRLRHRPRLAPRAPAG